MLEVIYVPEHIAATGSLSEDEIKVEGTKKLQDGTIVCWALNSFDNTVENRADSTFAISSLRKVPLTID